MNQIFKEEFNGAYDSMTPATMLPKGAISGGGNVRKVSQLGGWKARKGCALHNTTALESGAAVKSLHYYTNPVQGDEHFIAQVSQKLVRESASGKLPPTQDTSFGTTLGVTVGTTPGFGDVVGEHFFYADGSGVPIAWGGDTPYPRAVFTYDAGTGIYTDFSREVRDGRSTTYAVVLGAATDKFFVLSEQQLSGVTITVGSSVNSNDVDLVVKALRGGSWTAVSSLSDGTDSSGTLAQTGAVTWTASTSDQVSIVSNTMGYVYEFSWSGALSGNVYITKLTVTQAAQALTNKWGGRFDWLSGCRFFDADAKEYQDGLGQISNESTAQSISIGAGTTSDFLYLKTPEPACAFAIGVVIGSSNTAAQKIDSIEGWGNGAWTAVTSGLTDGTLNSDSTSSFAQSGAFKFPTTTLVMQKAEMFGDPVPGYWYRISWDGTLSDTVELYAIAYAAQPETLPAYDGCIEFKGRLFVWGDPEYPNRLRYSAYADPFCFCGQDSGYTDVFGDMKKVLCVKRFYNELIIWKEDSIYLLEGENPQTFGTLKISDTIGLASPKTAYVVELGYNLMHKDEPLSVAIWQEIDGVYIIDGRKPKKVSASVDRYFNPEYSDCISATYIRSLQAYIDYANGEYHLLLPSSELVYNIATGEFYPVWTRAITLATGLGFRGATDRKISMGASAAGFVMLLETDTSDKNASNADVAITHSIKTRAISAKQDMGTTLRFTLRHLWTELKARAAGSLTTKTYKNQASSGTTQATPQAMSMISSTYAVVCPKLDMSIEECDCFQASFEVATIDHEMEIYSMLYDIDARGQIVQ